MPLRRDDRKNLLESEDPNRGRSGKYRTMDSDKTPDAEKNSHLNPSYMGDDGDLAGPEDQNAKKTPMELTSDGLESKSAEEQTQEEVVDHFEEVMRLVGHCGRWNIMFFALSFMPGFLMPSTIFSYQFVGATPSHWCHVDPLLEANWTTDQIIDLAIPRKADGKLEGCFQRDYNYSLAASLGYEAAKDNLDLITIVPNGTVSCSKRDFNLTQYSSTLTTEFDLVCERRALYATTQSCTQIGKLVTCLFIGFLTNRFGRRTVSLCSMLLFLLCGLLTPTAPSIELYIVGKFFMSVFDMSLFVSTYILAMEFCATSQRAILNGIGGIVWDLGMMMVPGIAYLIRDWRTLQLVLALPYSTIAIYFWLQPESPRWLMLQGRYDDVVKLLKRIASMNRRQLPPDEKLRAIVERIGNSIRESNVAEEAGGDFRQKVKDSIRKTMKEVSLLFRNVTIAKQTLIVFFCWFAVAFMYFGVAQNGSALGANEYWYMFFGALVEMPVFLILIPALTYVGRKKTLITSYSIASVSIFASLGISGSVSWAVALSLIGKGAAASCFSIVYLFTSEINTTKTRSWALGMSSVIARFGSIVTPYINNLLGETYPWSPSAIFGTVAFMAAVLVFFLPETKKNTLPESISDVERLGNLKKLQTQKSDTPPSDKSQS